MAARLHSAIGGGHRSSSLITVALGIIEHLNGVLHDLDLELARFARRQPGCRALMAHYGIGSRVATAIVAELGDARVPLISP